MSPHYGKGCFWKQRRHIFRGQRVNMKIKHYWNFLVNFQWRQCVTIMILISLAWGYSFILFAQKKWHTLLHRMHSRKDETYVRSPLCTMLFFPMPSKYDAYTFRREISQPFNNNIIRYVLHLLTRYPKNSINFVFYLGWIASLCYLYGESQFIKLASYLPT